MWAHWAKPGLIQRVHQNQSSCTLEAVTAVEYSGVKWKQTSMVARSADNSRKLGSNGEADFNGSKHVNRSSHGWLYSKGFGVTMQQLQYGNI